MPPNYLFTWVGLSNFKSMFSGGTTVTFSYAFVRILAEEIVNEIKNNARVDVAIPPGILTSFGTGANAGGPVSVFSTNTTPTVTNGIVR